MSPWNATPLTRLGLRTAFVALVVIIAASSTLVAHLRMVSSDPTASATVRHHPAWIVAGSAEAAPAAADPGARIYGQHCAQCHGAGGKGDGPAAASLNPRPRNHTNGAYMNSRTDAELLNSIRNGKGAMPAMKGQLSDADIHAVLAHVRSLAVPPYGSHAAPTKAVVGSHAAPRLRHSSRTKRSAVRGATHAK